MRKVTHWQQPKKKNGKYADQNEVCFFFVCVLLYEWNWFGELRLPFDFDYNWLARAVIKSSMEITMNTCFFFCLRDRLFNVTCFRIHIYIHVAEPITINMGFYRRCYILYICTCIDIHTLKISPNIKNDRSLMLRLLNFDCTALASKTKEDITDRKIFAGRRSVDLMGYWHSFLNELTLFLVSYTNTLYPWNLSAVKENNTATVKSINIIKVKHNESCSHFGVQLFKWVFLTLTATVITLFYVYHEY